MGICGSKLKDGSICDKQTVWNDMCEDCLNDYEDQMYGRENPHEDTLLEALSCQRSERQQQLDFIIRNDSHKAIVEIYQAALDRTIEAIKWVRSL